MTGLLVFGSWQACSKLFLRAFKPWVSSFCSPWGLVAFELLVLFLIVLPAACMSCSVLRACVSAPYFAGDAMHRARDCWHLWGVPAAP